MQPGEFLQRDFLDDQGIIHRWPVLTACLRFQFLEQGYWGEPSVVSWQPEGVVL